MTTFSTGLKFGAPKQENPDIFGISSLETNNIIPGNIMKYGEIIACVRTLTKKNHNRLCTLIAITKQPISLYLKEAMKQFTVKGEIIFYDNCFEVPKNNTSQAQILRSRHKRKLKGHM